MKDITAPKQNDIKRQSTRPHCVKVWLNDDERRMIVTRAKADGMGMSAWLRKAIMER